MIKAKSLNSLFITSTTSTSTTTTSPNLLHNHKRFDIKTTLECPICQESFLNTTQILTCCAHLFHTDCLRSWERLLANQSNSNGNGNHHTSIRKCPVCRKEDYHRLQTRCGHEMAYTRSIVQIQTWWRGRWSYLKFQKVWEKHVPKDTRVRRRKLERKLESLSTTNTNTAKHHHGHHRLALPPLGTKKLPSQLDLFLEGLDAGNAVAAEYIQQALDKLTLKKQRHGRQLLKPTTFWKMVMDKILQRGVIDCVICLQGICLESIINTHQKERTVIATTQPPHPPSSSTYTYTYTGKKGKKVVMFGCSHILHAPCFSIYEESIRTDPLLSTSSASTSDPTTPVIACPVCRAPTTIRKYLTTMIWLNILIVLSICIPFPALEVHYTFPTTTLSFSFSSSLSKLISLTVSKSPFQKPKASLWKHNWESVCAEKKSLKSWCLSVLNRLNSPMTWLEKAVLVSKLAWTASDN